MKNFLLLLILLKTKPPIDFFAQNSVQFGRRAKRGDLQIVDFSLLAPVVGFEPTTKGLHQTSIFIKGWTISSSFRQMAD